MKQRFIMFRRVEVFYCEDTTTGRQTSLRTKIESEAITLLNTKNEATRQPAMNLQIAQVYLQHADQALSTRTWENVMDAMSPLKKGLTQARWISAMRDRAYDSIRSRKLIETTSMQFLEVLNNGTVSTNMFLRRLHNFAVGMHWLPWPVLPKRQWPTVKHKERRAITPEEHRKIVEREHNPEIRAYYQLLWHLGGSQTDIAELTAEDVDWADRTLSYSRNKNDVPAVISFGAEAAAILQSLPKFGPLFPRLARIKENHRAKMFIKRLKTVGITGISLHSYRYAWAERAKTVGMPERFAQQALGHSSKAFARAYSKKAKVIVPSLEDYERKIVPMPIAVNQ
ncbi:MAG TPA: tyrosine-type recombinase/integrase [Verrucomicrobiae bacterium]|jgi:integrase